MRFVRHAEVTMPLQSSALNRPPNQPSQSSSKIDPAQVPRPTGRGDAPQEYRTSGNQHPNPPPVQSPALAMLKLPCYTSPAHCLQIDVLSMCPGPSAHNLCQRGTSRTAASTCLECSLVMVGQLHLDTHLKRQMYQYAAVLISYGCLLTDLRSLHMPVRPGGPATHCAQ